MVEIPQKEIPAVYVAFMEEIKLRIDHGRASLQAGFQRREEPDAFLSIEFAYLQLRRITELMALAVLVAHNQVEDFRTSRFLEKWNADTIFGILARLNEDGFPAPIRINDVPPELRATHGNHQIEIIREGHLTKSQLVKIYHACGEKLHAGSLKHLFKRGRPVYDLGEIEQWFNSIVLLLSHHIVRLPEMKTTLIVAMAQEPDGHAHCAVSSLVAEGPLHNVPASPRIPRKKHVKPRKG